MSNLFDAAQSVGEIVAAFPGASNLFKAHRIDFCCGGGKSLSDALRARGVDEETFLAALNEAYAADELRRKPTDVDWRVAPLEKLIRRIVMVHHEYLKQELPVLSGFVRKISAVHGGRHPELVTLDGKFHELKAELESHIAKEEAQVFPLIRTYAETQAQEDLVRAIAALDKLEAEHEAAGGLLAEMRELTGGYALPADACRTYTLSFDKLSELESDMFTHVHLENNILFPRLRGAMVA